VSGGVVEKGRYAPLFRQAAALALVLGLVSPAALALATPRVWVTGAPNCVHSWFRPHRILVDCADGAEFLKNLTWSHWGTRRASGKGTEVLNDCTPDCADGHEHFYPVSVALSRPRACRHRVHKVFTRLVVTFGAQRPFPTAIERDRLTCPL
jgi:hypothetical protein